MNVRRSRFRRPARRGFTLIELLVVISIIATLASLVLPAVQNARATARRTQCQSNLRNVGLAVQAYSTAHNGQVPSLTGGFKINLGLSTDLPQAASRTWAPWSVHLLPYLEQQALYDRLQQSTNDLPINANSSSTLAMTAIETFICPDDQNGGNGSLSYVANAGYMYQGPFELPNDQFHRIQSYDYNFDGYSAIQREDDFEVAAATGVFWRQYQESSAVLIRIDAGRVHSLDRISSGDGTSQTILLSENINTRNFSGGTYGGWVSPYTGEIAFGVIVPDPGVTEVLDNSYPGGIGTAGTSKAQGLVLSSTAIADKRCKINANLLTATDGANARPSSLHPGVVNMAFADGSCKVISQNIDESVYCRLVTPFGNRHGQDILSASDY